MNQERKIREAGKEANRLVLSRTIKLMVVFGVLIFIPLIMQLYRLQVADHDKLEELAVNQQTSTLSISASRGTIYDANKNVLAISSTVYDVILSPKAIAEKQQELQEIQEKNNEFMDVRTEYSRYRMPALRFEKDHQMGIQRKRTEVSLQKLLQ